MFLLNSASPELLRLPYKFGSTLLLLPKGQRLSEKACQCPVRRAHQQWCTLDLNSTDLRAQAQRLCSAGNLLAAVCLHLASMGNHLLLAGSTLSEQSCNATVPRMVCGCQAQRTWCKLHSAAPTAEFSGRAEQELCKFLTFKRRCSGQVAYHIRRLLCPCASLLLL